MSIVNAKEIMMVAAKEKYAVGAFNITDLVQMEAVVEAAVAKKAPLIIQTSVKPTKFLGINVLVAIYRTLAESAPIPICLHLDHCTEIEHCKKCADAGYTNIMIDASKQPYETNISQTREVVEYCHKAGDISVEGELGTVGGLEDQLKVAEDEAQLANPLQAVEFVEATGLGQERRAEEHRSPGERFDLRRCRTGTGSCRRPRPVGGRLRSALP